MGDTITQIGVGGVLAVIIIREVFTFMAKNKSTNSVVRQSTCDQVQKRFEGLFEAQEKHLDKIDSSVSEGFDEVKKLIKDSHGT